MVERGIESNHLQFFLFYLRRTMYIQWSIIMNHQRKILHFMTCKLFATCLLYRFSLCTSIHNNDHHLTYQYSFLENNYHDDNQLTHKHKWTKFQLKTND